MKNRLTAAVFVLVASLAPLTGVSAQERIYGGGPGPGFDRPDRDFGRPGHGPGGGRPDFGHQPDRRDNRHGNHNDAWAAGVLGLVIGGAVAASTIDRGDRIPVIRQPSEPPRWHPALRPWSPQWYRWCSDRWRSFDSRTGFFIGRDGRRHFCEAD
jgi:hypothetical protein